LNGELYSGWPVGHNLLTKKEIAYANSISQKKTYCIPSDLRTDSAASCAGYRSKT